MFLEIWGISPSLEKLLLLNSGIAARTGSFSRIVIQRNELGIIFSSIHSAQWKVRLQPISLNEFINKHWLVGGWSVLGGWERWSVQHNLPPSSERGSQCIQPLEALYNLWGVPVQAWQLEHCPGYSFQPCPGHSCLLAHASLELQTNQAHFSSF